MGIDVVWTCQDLAWRGGGSESGWWLRRWAGKDELGARGPPLERKGSTSDGQQAAQVSVQRADIHLWVQAAEQVGKDLCGLGL